MTLSRFPFTAHSCREWRIRYSRSSMRIVVDEQPVEYIEGDSVPRAAPAFTGDAERPLIDAGGGHMIRCVIPAEQLVELQKVAR